MSIDQFIDSYRIATGGNYYFRLEEAILFVSDAEEATGLNLQDIKSYAAMLYDVNEEDL